MKQTLLIALVLLSLTVFSQDKKAYQIFNEKGKKITYKKMAKECSKTQIVLFGEMHNDPIDHWLQLELSKSIYFNNSKMVLGAEMIEADNQNVLNQYLAGELDADSLKKTARLWPNYNTDYKPLVDFAKENNLKFVASNIPRRYASKVFKGGFEVLDTLPSNEKEWIATLPIKYDKSLPGYVAMLDMMGGHGGENFPKAQAIKDATMAHFITENHIPSGIFIHYNGTYHSNNKEGIMWYLQQHNPDFKIVTIASVNQSELKKLDAENVGLADFIICTPDSMTKTY